MPRFNPRAVSVSNAPADTTNLAGGVAFAQDTRQEIIGLLLTSFLADEHYRSGNDTVARLRTLVQRAPIEDMRFIAKAAILARTKFGMRSVTHLTAAEVVRRMSIETYRARTKATKPDERNWLDAHVAPPKPQLHTPEWVRRFVDLAIFRVDDALEMVQAYTSAYGKPIPHAMLRGIADNIGRRSPYALAKYRGESRGLKLIDLVRLTHPKPTAENAEAFEALVKGTLTSQDTWESKLTRAGQEATDDEDKATRKTEAWSTLLAERKLGHFALLRNLRNIAQQAPAQLDEALKQLTDPQAILKSLVMPFRYATAYREFNDLTVNASGYSYRQRDYRTMLQPRNIEGIDGQTVRKISIALNTALDISLSNVPRFPGRTMVWLDNSGSMQNTMDAKAPIWIGSIFAAVLAKANSADLGTFTDDAHFMSYNPGDSTLTIAEKLMASSVPQGTNFNSIFPKMTQGYDRIIILSDMQGWMPDTHQYGYHQGGAPVQTFKDYRARYKVDPFVYSFDLRNYGSLMFNPDNPKVFQIGGFSAEIFKIMSVLEGDRDALIKEIESVEL